MVTEMQNEERYWPMKYLYSEVCHKTNINNILISCTKSYQTQAAFNIAV